MLGMSGSGSVSASSHQPEVLRLTTSFTDSLSQSGVRHHVLTDFSSNAHRFSVGSSSSHSANMTDIRAIEHPTLKVPYEILNKKFRTAQKNIDREVSKVQTAVADLEKGLKKVQSASTKDLNKSSSDGDKPSSGGGSGSSSKRESRSGSLSSLNNAGGKTGSAGDVSEKSELTEGVSEGTKVTKGSGVDQPTVGAISELLSGVIEKLNAFKRKAEESINDELTAAGVCKKRLDHLKEYCVKSANASGTSGSASDSAYVAKWKKKRLDRMLVEHFLRCGYYDSALKLGQSSEITELTNIDLFLVSREVENSLKKRETAKCLNWCYDNKSKLRKIKSNLEFNLRQQEFIEMIRNNKRMEGVKHVRKYLSSLEEGQQKEFQHVMGLFAFKPDTRIEPYKSLFDESRWDLLVEEFRQENFKLFQLSCTSVFSVTLQSGLSALKTPQCYRKDGERVADCPVCSELMNCLAESLPCAHCSQSRLVCHISGQPLNEHNQPMVLPNGYVYGLTSLKRMAALNSGKIICPRTKRVFDLNDAEKVFVM